MSNIKSLRDVLIEELQDLYSAENQLLKALPKMAKKSSNSKLKEAFESHLEETNGQIEKLQQISKIIKFELEGKTCKAMKGLIEEAKEILEEESENDTLIDSLLIGAARRIEHYEMAAYSTVCSFARKLEESETEKLVNEILTQETNADKKLLSLLDKIVLKDYETSNKNLNSQMPSKQDKTKSIPSSLKNLILCTFIASSSYIYSSPAISETKQEAYKNEMESKQYQNDNTGKNLRDKNEYRKTAEDQSFNSNETEVLAKIRKGIMANDTLSTNAHNVKIMLNKNEVTLRGPVNTIGEKNWIEQSTSKIVPNYKLINELEVVSSN